MINVHEKSNFAQLQLNGTTTHIYRPSKYTLCHTMPSMQISLPEDL